LHFGPGIRTRNDSPHAAPMVPAKWQQKSPAAGIGAPQQY